MVRRALQGVALAIIQSRWKAGERSYNVKKDDVSLMQLEIARKDQKATSWLRTSQRGRHEGGGSSPSKLTRGPAIYARFQGIVNP